MNYTIRIETDHDPMNPRVDYDHVGVMYCEHSRYMLGDKGADDAFEEVEGNNLDGMWLTTEELEYILECFEEICHELDGSEETAGLWTFAGAEVVRKEIEDLIYSRKERRQLRSDVRIALPIYLYDHSGITISHGDFGDPWDSGCVGVHYITHDAVKKNWPDGATDEQLQKMLECELEVYDHYLQGNAWGYVIETEDGEQDDSCWGFFGDELEYTGILDHVEGKFHAAIREAWDKRFDHASTPYTKYATVTTDEMGNILEGE